MKYFYQLGLLSAIFLVGYYYIFYVVFLHKEKDYTSPALKERLGTILWQSSDTGKQTTENIYCYYPKDSASYKGRSGEYIIKKVGNLGECRDWLGIVLIKERSSLSELDKIYWKGS